MTKTIVTVAACAALLWIGTAQAAGTAQQKCQQAKLKAQGKLQACLKKTAAGVIGGKVDASADCRTKFQAALTKADATATRAATSCRYIDNGDGTVSDLNTGLQWEKKVDIGVCTPYAECAIHDKEDTPAWSNGGGVPDGEAFTYFLGTLNGGTSSDGTDTPTPCFTGHCDWRLPTVQELAGILDLTRGSCGGGNGPCIDPAFGPTQANFYWSATTYAGYPNFAWLVVFYDGLVVNFDKTNTIYVRAVRGGL